MRGSRAFSFSKKNILDDSSVRTNYSAVKMKPEQKDVPSNYVPTVDQGKIQYDTQINQLEKK